jgi:dihydrofolate reductase
MTQGSVFIAFSLDGLIARDDGGIDWLRIVERPGEDYGYAVFFAQIDALVMGRKTYDTASSFPSWPYAGKRVVVLTHRAITPREGVESFAGDPRALLAKLAQQGVNHSTARARPNYRVEMVGEDVGWVLRTEFLGGSATAIGVDFAAKNPW